MQMRSFPKKCYQFAGTYKVIDKPNTSDTKKTTLKSEKSGQWKSTWIASFEK